MLTPDPYALYSNVVPTAFGNVEVPSGLTIRERLDYIETESKKLQERWQRGEFDMLTPNQKPVHHPLSPTDKPYMDAISWLDEYAPEEMRDLTTIAVLHAWQASKRVRFDYWRSEWFV